MNLHRILSTTAVATSAVLISIGIQALAYSPPTAVPPAGDASAPLNTSATVQTKAGDLNIGGKVKLGGATIGAADIGLAIAGRLRIQGGSPNGGDVLASDGTGGDSTWKDPVVDLGLQDRVTGTCAIGSAIRSIAVDGTVTCNTPSIQVIVGTENTAGTLGCPAGTECAAAYCASGYSLIGCSASRDPNAKDNGCQEADVGLVGVVPVNASGVTTTISPVGCRAGGDDNTCTSITAHAYCIKL